MWNEFMNEMPGYNRVSVFHVVSCNTPLGNKDIDIENIFTIFRMLILARRLCAHTNCVEWNSGIGECRQRLNVSFTTLVRIFVKVSMESDYIRSHAE